MAIKKYIVVAGPTASGKSALSLKLAKELNGEIVNCDSVQLYRDFDIGSAKPTRQELADVPHHLIDFLDGNQDYDANLYADAARQVITEISSRGKIPIVVGGTGLYLRALWGRDFDKLPKDDSLRLVLAEKSEAELLEIAREKAPLRLSRIHPNDRFRLLRVAELALLIGDDAQPKENSDTSDDAFKIYVKVKRSLLHQRIEQRVVQMLQDGLIEEVMNLNERYAGTSCKPLQSIGYKQVLQSLNQKINVEELASQITIATRQYAKRQETWFRKVDFDFYYENSNQYQNILAEFAKNFI